MPYNEASKKAAQKYKAAKIKRIPLDMQISQYEAVQAHAVARGESVNGFIKRAIAEVMERDNAAAGALTETKREDA